MRTGSLILIVWLIIGAIAGGQRHYYGNSNPNCARAGTIAVTVLAGPLNYVGVNPKVACKAPQPPGDRQGRVSSWVIGSGDGPCSRCLFPPRRPSGLTQG